MSEAAVAANKPETLAERFWALARGMSGVSDSIDPVAVVRHVLAVLDALAAGDSGDSISVRTVSFLKLLRESEQQGELSYAAPEQLCGEMLDERSLVFSVGVLLFERLTGRHPFGAEGNNPIRLARIQKGEFGSGVNYFPTVPAGLRQILMKAMGPFPEERWSSLDEMRSRLEQFVENERQPLSLPGTSPPSKRRVPASDNAPTQIVNMAERVATELSVAAGRAATEPSLASLIPAANPAHGRAREATDAAASPPPPPPQPKAEPLPLQVLPTAEAEPSPGALGPSLRTKLPLTQIAWVGTGAAITALLFILFGGSAPAPIAARAAAPDRATTPPTESPPVAIKAAPTPAPTPPLPAAAPEPKQTVAAPSAVFDPELSGHSVATAARTCFPPERLARGLSFSLGILYAGADGHIKRVYYPKNEEISVEQRRCVRAALTSQAANHTPDADTIVNYRLRLADGGDRIRFKLP